MNIKIWNYKVLKKFVVLALAEIIFLINIELKKKTVKSRTPVFLAFKIFELIIKKT